MRIVYNSFHGRFCDSPRALWERIADVPGIDHVWLADAAYADAFPTDVRTVDVDGPETRAVLESADVVLANSHTEVEWDKPATTTYVQTWHGTPLKRIHHDVLWAPEGRLERLDRDIARWDLLLSPNSVSSPRLAKAFRFDGPVVETGYPRNDLLASPKREERATQVRDELGIPAGRLVVLYAPTWRDHEVFDGTGEIPLPLDLAHFRACAGPEPVLLVRAHNMVTGRLAAWSDPDVIDVSYYPDIRELYLLADVLITDYSSAMFDFAGTGRPILFLAHDLESFRDTTRGFYFDLEEVAPGPLATSVEQLADELCDLPAVHERYADRYAAFRATFCHLDDGNATDRVLDLVRLA